MTSKKTAILILVFWILQGCTSVEISSTVNQKPTLKPKVVCMVIKPALGYTNFFSDIQDQMEAYLREKDIEVRTLFTTNAQLKGEQKRIKESITTFNADLVIDISVSNDQLTEYTYFDPTTGRQQPNSSNLEIRLVINIISTRDNTRIWNSQVTTNTTPIFQSNPRSIRGKQTAKNFIQKLEEDGIL